MRWQGRKQSDNVEDRRGEIPPVALGAAAPLVLRFLPTMLRSKMGRTILIVGIIAIVGGKLLGIDVLGLLLGGGAQQQPAPPTAEEQELAQFSSVVLADTEETWNTVFRQHGRTYSEPTLVLFTAGVNSACGQASAAVGPFYCPMDQKLYLDLSFFRDLRARHGAPGDFAQAYVIAHEVGHHVQTLLGISQQVQQLGRGRSQEEVNALSVRQELQADCFAGVWGHEANARRQLLDPGDLEEALQAASAIGDDRLQREAGARVVPDSFTHGSSEQRVQWFSTGFRSGRMEDCDTFGSGLR